ncbi:MAG: right-handed parallel beta-helix repeat-containing protein [Phycisphaerales bacterium]|nr:right-handed parallel beta-helix repeat-containing protein [Phycisphaerales bacterium]
MSRSSGFGVAALAAILSTSLASASTLYVDDDAALGGDGLGWGTAFAFLGDALTAAALDPMVTEIRLAGGVYQPDRSDAVPLGTGDRVATFALVDGVDLRGGFAGPGAADPNLQDPATHETILSGDLAGDDGPSFAGRADNALHVVTAIGSPSPNQFSGLLEGVTISGGEATGTSSSDRFGGGLRLRFAGGNAFSGDLFTVRQCIITDNRALFGGGGYSAGTSQTRFTRCTFIGNHASQQSGGLHCTTGSSPIISNCRFLGNHSDGSAGALHVRQFASTTEVVNTHFCGNSANLAGGAVYAIVATSSFSNCTFAGNVAGTEGGGIVTAYGGSTRTTFVRNCILWGNVPDQVTPLSGAGNTLNVRTTIVEGGLTSGGHITAVDIVDADPLFVNALGLDGIAGTLDDDLRLQAGSPAVERGQPSFIANDNGDLDGDGVNGEPSPLDLDDLDRVVDADDDGDPIVDLGAFEFRQIDTDNDGLLDADEIVRGTDPHDPDTDDDGLDDGVEVTLAAGGSCPNPLDADSDGDGDLDGPDNDACDAKPIAEILVAQLVDIGADAVAQLDALTSTDAESPLGDLLYEWTIDTDVVCSGNAATCGVIEVDLAFGDHDVELAVTDPAGGVGVAQTTITLLPASLSVLEIEKAKIEFDKTPPKFKLSGEIGLPFGVDFSEVSPTASVGLTLAGVDVLPAPLAVIEFEATGGDGGKWKYRDDDATTGVTKCDIDWSGGQLRYKDLGVDLKTEIITSDETTLRVKYKLNDIGGAFTVDLDGITQIAVAADGTLTTNATIVEVKPGKEATLTLPHPITEASIITLGGSIVATVAAADHLTASVGRYKIEGVFDASAVPDGAANAYPSVRLDLFAGASGYDGSAELLEADLEIKPGEWKDD